MVRAHRSVFVVVCVLIGNGWLVEAKAGSFAPTAGQSGSTAISASSSQIVGWATTVAQLIRGPQNISVVGSPLASFGAAADAIGPANGTSVVSLGDGGQITLGFAQPITNGPGPDFAVFENGFASGGLSYLELGFVEVSSDGANFFRFDATSLTLTATQVGSFGLLDATNLNNLAGKYVANFGTPFDLQELAGRSPLLDVNNVQYVRVVDAVGSIDPNYATHDYLGNVVNEPFPTAFASGGFDFDAIGVINQVPEPGAFTLAAIGATLTGLIGKRRARKAIARGTHA